MKIVVTGARGFIGSVFCARAKELGHEVYGIDDESRGLNPVEEVLGERYIRYDCRKGFRVLNLQSVDVVVHLAAATGSLERPIEELRELNVDMTKYVYQDALALGARAFLWPTTSLAIAVPDSPYVQSKEEALKMLKDVDAQARVSIPVRFFNVAGAYRGFTERRKREVHVVPVMLQAFQQQQPFTINGTNYQTIDGTPSRDFVHVTNVTDYLLRLARRKLAGGQIQTHPQDGAVWTGTGRSLTVKQLTALFEEEVGPLQVQYGGRRAYDCGALVVDPEQQENFESCFGTLILPSQSIRDELAALRKIQ